MSLRKKCLVLDFVETGGEAQNASSIQMLLFTKIFRQLQDDESLRLWKNGTRLLSAVSMEFLF